MKRPKTSQEIKQVPPIAVELNLPREHSKVLQGHPVDDPSLASKAQEANVAQLLEGVPMQSRRRLSISPEADETLDEIAWARCP